MKLSQLFSGQARTDGSGRASQPSPAQAELTARQVRSLVPGQTVSGEILSRNGNEIQIRLSEDMVLNARIDRGMNIEIGKNVTFEVKSNGSSLTLSPLFTNVATDVNVLKALDMAGLPVNRDTVDMTERMMAAGMSVSKGTLQQIFREATSFPQAAVQDIISLHRLQMPVNEANVSQMASYRNLTHQLVGGMEAVLGALPEALDALEAQGDLPGALRLYQEVLKLVQDSFPRGGAGGEEGGVSVLRMGISPEGAGAVPAEAGSRPGEAAVLGQLPAEEGLSAGGGEGASALLPPGKGLPAGGGDGAAPLPPGEAGLPVGGGDGTAPLQPGKGLPDAGRELPLRQPEAGPLRGLVAAVAGEALELLDSLRLSPKEASEIRAQLQYAGGQGDPGQLFAQLAGLADAARGSGGSMKALARLFFGTAFRDLLSGALRESWTLEPEEVALPGRVEELYRRMDRQLKVLAAALEGAGQTGTEAFRAAASMSQNLDFLQQVNQMYAYVQLPLRLQQGDAHGELYVYSNKRNLAKKDGTVSALLHLDMEHLGPVDVYVAMQENKVGTKFYLRDDEMIGFLAGHMEVLTERLRKRGYDCTYAMTVRDGAPGEATKGGLEPVLGQERGILLSKYAFDVRT